MKDFSVPETEIHKLIENELLLAHFASILAEVNSIHGVFPERSAPEIAKFDSNLFRLPVWYFHYTGRMTVLNKGNVRFMCQKIGVPPERTVTITNTCEKTVPFLPERLPGSPYLLTNGCLVPLKGFNRLIRMSAEIAKPHPEEHLVICGAGKNREILKTPAGSLNLSGKIHFQGECRNLALWNRYADARSFTSHDKGWGNVIMRTMLQGLPVIALGGRYGAVEMITSYRNGIPVPLDNGRLDYIRKTAAYLDRLPESRARYSVETIHAEYFYSGKSLSLQRSNCRSKKKGTIRISKLRRTFQTRGILRSLYSFGFNTSPLGATLYSSFFHFCIRLVYEPCKSERA